VACVTFTVIAAYYQSKKYDAIRSVSVHAEICVVFSVGGSTEVRRVPSRTEIALGDSVVRNVSLLIKM
jgi:hypothetical protein